MILHLSNILLASAVPFLASCNHMEFNPRTNSPPFHLLAIHSTSAIQLQPINARFGGFYVGEGPNTACPQSPCPVLSQTGFFAANGKGYLDVSVAGGQNLFVGPHGALSFTSAGSPSAIPEGAATANFTLTPGIGDAPGSLTFSGLGTDTFLACPIYKPESILYQVFANVTGVTDVVVPGGDVGACIGIGAAAYTYTYEDNAVAYEYE